jgi:RNA polymerase sigma-70 factor (ECF subfamily)
MLVAEVLDGETESFAGLVDRYKNLVASYVAARVPAREVEDLAQETFLRGFKALGSLRDPSAFSSWLLGIANHVCVDWHRSRRRTAALDAEFDVSDDALPPHRQPAERPDESAERAEDARLLLQALDGLPETYRVTLTLKHMDGLSCTDIADQLGIALGTVTSRLARGYGMLRDKLDALVNASRTEQQ